MNRKLSPIFFLAVFLVSVGFASANLTQLELTPTSLTCNATGTIYYSSASNQLMLCTSGTGSSPIVTGASNVWTLSGSNLYPNSTSYNVGIGTTAPGVYYGQQAILDVNGYAAIGGLRIKGSDTVNTIYQTNDIGIKTAGGGIQILNSNGNVGIGTTNPSTAGLVVSTNISSVGIDVSNNRIQNVGTPINTADAATKSYVDSAVTTGISGGISGTSGYLAKFTGTNTVGNSGIYQSGNNIGIGTVSPFGNLNVYGLGWSDQSNYADSSSMPSSTSAVGLVLAYGYNNDQYTTRFVKIDRGGNIPLYVQQTTGTPNAYTNVARFGFNQYDSNAFEVFGNTSLLGNVGIGNTNPYTKFQISDVSHPATDSNSGSAAFAVTVGGGQTAPGIRMGYDTAANVGWIQSSIPGSTNEPLLLNSQSGNVGINTTSPGTNLDVNGNAQASIFYDRDNTNYYLDPAANTMPYAANLGGSVNVSGSGYFSGNVGIGTIAPQFALDTRGIVGGSLLGEMAVGDSFGTGAPVGDTFYAGQIGKNLESNSENTSRNGGSGTWTTATTTSPSGSTIASYTFTGGDNWIGGVPSTGPLAAGQYTLSFYAKVITPSSAITFSDYFLNGAETGVTWGTVSTSQGWVRLSHTFTVSSGQTLGFIIRAANNIQFSIWGWQIEAGPTMSLYERTDNTLSSSATGYGMWAADFRLGGTPQDPNSMWDNADNRLGIGTTAPSYALSVKGSMYSIEVDNGTSTTATTIDWSQSNTQTLVLGANIALTFTNGQPGGHYTLALKQDTTGSRTITSWGSNVRWSSGVAPTLTTTANKTDYIEFVYDGLSSTFDGVGFNANF